MVIIVALAFFLLIFFVMRKHAGVPMLAMIAGLSVYELFGQDFANFITNLISGADFHLVQTIIYLILVLLFPLLLYFRGGRGGLSGLFRLAECIAFAAILTSLIATPLAEFLPFDTLSRDIASFIASIKGYIVLAGVLLAYLDVLFYRSSID